MTRESPIRHQPGGAFQIEHFWNADDKRTHIDRINPLDGKSPSDGTGAHGVYHREDLQTHNVTGAVIWAQIPAAPAVEDKPFESDNVLEAHYE
jgi:hypothetical protein